MSVSHQIKGLVNLLDQFYFLRVRFFKTKTKMTVVSKKNKIK